MNELIKPKNLDKYVIETVAEDVAEIYKMLERFM